jgi:hypothetical protein
LNRARESREQAQSERNELSTSLEALNERLSDGAGPWAVDGRMAGLPFVIVSETQDLPEWREHVVSSLTNAGAVPSGSILFGPRWALSESGDLDALVEVVREVDPAFEEGNNPPARIVELLGNNIFEPVGRALLDALAERDFISIQGRPDGVWPAPGSAVVILSESKADETARPRWVSALASSVGAQTPTLATTNSPLGESVVSDLREEEDLSQQLTTFDSATDADDPGGIGVVAALVAATEERGGHYGTAPDLTFVPAPNTDN